MTASKWPNFTIEELQCRCCHRLEMDEMFMDKLVSLRERVRFGMPVSSGFRCPNHNSEVSTTGLTGPHVLGVAVDVQIARYLATILIHEALNMGFLGIGIRQHGPEDKRIVHLDTAPRTSQIIWTY